MRTADFINTVGVNAHISQGTAEYSNSADVTSDLHYLGIENVRDSYNPYWASNYEALAKSGAKFDFLSFVGGAPTTASIQSFLSNVASLETAVPGSVASVEGPNEINNFPLTYNGVGGLQGAVNLQEELYSLTHSDAALKGVYCNYFTGYNAGGIANGPNPATTAGLADYDTQHPYPGNGQPPLGWVNRTQALGNENPANGPAVYTETGYSTNQGTTVAQQAGYTLDLLMDDAQSGIAKTYLYQLMDENDGYELFNASNQPEPVATAIHDLTTILSDTGATASTFTPTTENYTVSGLPSTGHSMELQKSNGATDIVVWNEATGTAPSAVTTTVQLGGNYKTVEVFNPITSSSPIETLSNVSSVTLILTNSPMIIETEPGSTPTPPPAPNPIAPTPAPIAPTPATDTLMLSMSEDYYTGDARFTVKVDGTQVGGVETASVLHSTSDSGIFLLTGNWGTGAQSVQISFLNDAYAGTPTTDRNLYVNSIAYNGTTESGTAATLLSNGSKTFAVGGATPAATAPADNVVLQLSEDAWQGNADFTLSIDGKQVSTPQAVTALHSAGATQGFAFAGNLAAGAHTIGVSFTNDAYGGTAATDRNLYVNAVTVNGQSYGSGTTTLLSDGTATFHVMTTH